MKPLLLRASVSIGLLIPAALMVTASAANLIVNGDFEDGATGFDSDEVYIPGGFTQPGQYGIATDPSIAFTNGYASYTDHTSGAGLMMVVDGGPPSDVFWSQTVTLDPGTGYRFELWAASADALNPAALRLSVGGLPIGDDFTLTSEAGVWQRFSVDIDAGAGGSTLLSLADSNASYGVAGNDFSIDDLTMTAAVPEPSTWASMLLGIGAAGLLRRRTDASARRAGRR